jgi:hypothetical protein
LSWARDWRIERHPAPGCPPGKAQATLDVAGALFAAAVADRANETLPRLGAESARRMGQAHLAFAAPGGAAQKGGFAGKRPRPTPKGRRDAEEVDRRGLRLQLLEQPAPAGAIVRRLADPSEAPTHPSLARAWAKRRRPGR